MQRIAAPLLALVSLTVSLAARADVIFVAPNGKAGAAGSAAAPLGRVQEALDRARAGDTVRLRPGVYRERVAFRNSGTYGKPVVLEGEPGAILDGSEAAALDWRPAPDIAPGVYRAKIAFPVFTLTADSKIITMLREDRVTPPTAKKPEWQWENLFKNGVGPSKWEGVKALSLYRPGQQEVLVRFKDDRDPRKIPMTAAPREPIVRISGNHRCVVRGLTLRNGAYGVYIEDSVGSVVERCVLGPVDYGVWMDGGADRCTVRFCEMFMDPYSGADPNQVGAWDNWQAHKTGGHYDRFGVQIFRTLGGHEIHDNLIRDQWDGIEDRGDPGENVGLRIHHNRIFNVSDDGLEPNGGEEDCRWYENIVERSICGFRIKAPEAGPMYAYRNIFIDNKEDYRNYGEVVLKPAVVYIYHNTSTSPAAITSNKVFGIGTPNYHYYNNLFWSAQAWSNSARLSVEPNWKADYNVYVRRGDKPAWDEMRTLFLTRGLDKNSLWTSGAPGFVDFEKHDLRLTADSPARGRGADLSRLFGKPLPGCEPGYFTGSAPDAGALAFGTPMPRLPRRPEDVDAPAAGTWPGAEADAALVTRNIPLENGGFESGAAAWGKLDAPRFVVKTDGGAEGKGYLTVTKGEGQTDLARRIAGLVPGRSYALTFWFRRNTSADARIILRDPANSHYIANFTPTSAQTWQKTTMRFTAPAAEASLEISLRAPGSVDLDGFTLEKRN